MYISGGKYLEYNVSMTLLARLGRAGGIILLGELMIRAIDRVR